jgi:hypothetical protein
MSVPGTEVVGPPPPDTRGTTDWAAVVAWCREHPGDSRRVDGKYANAAYSLRRRYPDITVVSRNFRFEGDRRVCDVWLTYEPQ